jgi:hypothetical protein
MIIQDSRHSDFLIAMHRRHDPDTSKEAAESVVDKLGKLQDIVLCYAIGRASEGFTDEMLSDWFGCRGSTYRTRRAELTAQGLIVPTRRRARLSSGRHAVVWCHRDYYQEEA